MFLLEVGGGGSPLALALRKEPRSILPCTGDRTRNIRQIHEILCATNKGNTSLWGVQLEDPSILNYFYLGLYNLTTRRSLLENVYRWASRIKSAEELNSICLNIPENTRKQDILSLYFILRVSYPAQRPIYVVGNNLIYSPELVSYSSINIDLWVQNYSTLPTLHRPPVSGKKIVILHAQTDKINLGPCPLPESAAIQKAKFYAGRGDRVYLVSTFPPNELIQEGWVAQKLLKRIDVSHKDGHTVRIAEWITHT